MVSTVIGCGYIAIRLIVPIPSRQAMERAPRRTMVLNRALHYTGIGFMRDIWYIALWHALANRKLNLFWFNMFWSSNSVDVYDCEPLFVEPRKDKRSRGSSNKFAGAICERLGKASKREWDDETLAEYAGTFLQFSKHPKEIVRLESMLLKLRISTWTILRKRVLMWTAICSQLNWASNQRLVWINLQNEIEN